MKNILLIIVALAVIAGAGIFFYNSYLNDAPNTDITISEPTDIVKAGVVTYNNPGQQEGVPYLIYEEPGKPALSKKLIFDALSFCTTDDGSLSCMAMSASFDIALGGKRAIIDGNEQGDSILVRKIRVLGESEEVRLYEPGNVFISWPEAVNLIKTCRVDGVMQTHALDVYLDLKDGRSLRTVEPVIDELFNIVSESADVCGSIGVATE